ncbi:MAG: hypothetical protein ABH883_01410, partial [Candidatus Omnitrophota bacterium]
MARGTEKEGAGAYNKLEVNAAEFILPEDLGSVKDSFAPLTGSPRGTVIHIQDAHCNYNAQKKISEIIGYLTSRYKVDVINLEGGSGDYDLSVLKEISGLDPREKTAAYFLKQGRINGAEYFAVNSDRDVFLWGVEDKGLYRENLDAYRNSLENINSAGKHLKSLEGVLNDLKAKLYSEKLKEFDTFSSGYLNGSLDFRSYIEFLLRLSLEHGLSLEKYPEIDRIRGTIEREKRIDFKRADVEKNSLLEELYSGISKKDREKLAVEILKFREKALSAHAFYGELAAEAAVLGIRLDKYSEMKKYMEYLSQYKAVDNSILGREIRSLEENIGKILCGSEKEERLMFLSGNLALMKKLFDVSLSGDEYSYYAVNKTGFRIHQYLSFLKEEGAYDEIVSDDNILRIDEYRESLEKFYECSFLRDKAFIGNMRFTPDGAAVLSGGAAILVTGGFHTENLLAEFKKRGIAYISIQPSFKNSVSDTNPYFDLLAGRGTEFQARVTDILCSNLAVPDILNRMGIEVEGENSYIAFLLEKILVEKVFSGEKCQGMIVSDNRAGGSGRVFHITKALDVKELDWEQKQNPPRGNITAWIFYPRPDKISVLVLEPDWIKKGTVIVRGDSPKIGWTVEMMGRRGGDIMVEMTREAAREWERGLKAKLREEGIPLEALNVTIPGAGSDEFRFVFSPEYFDKYHIEKELLELENKIYEKFRHDRILLIKQSTTMEERNLIRQIAGIRTVYAPLDLCAVWFDSSRTSEDLMKNRIKEILSEEQDLDCEAMKCRIPYLPLGAARALSDEVFDAVDKRADKIQEEMKNIPKNEGGRILAYDYECVEDLIVCLVNGLSTGKNGEGLLLKAALDAFRENSASLLDKENIATREDFIMFLYEKFKPDTRGINDIFNIIMKIDAARAKNMDTFLSHMFIASHSPEIRDVLLSVRSVFDDNSDLIFNAGGGLDKRKADTIRNVVDYLRDQSSSRGYSDKQVLLLLCSAIFSEQGLVLPVAEEDMINLADKARERKKKYLEKLERFSFFRKIKDTAASKEPEIAGLTLYKDLCVELDKFGCISREFLIPLLTELMTDYSPEKKGDYLFKNGPDEFYMAHCADNGEIDVYKTVHGYIAPENSEMKSAFYAAHYETGRADFRMPPGYVGRKMVGFKVLNTIFGHGAVNRGVIPAMAQTASDLLIEELSGKEGDFNGLRYVNKCSAVMNEYCSKGKNRFEVAVQAAVVTLSEKLGKSVSAAEAIETAKKVVYEIDKLLETRDVVRPVSTDITGYKRIRDFQPGGRIQEIQVAKVGENVFKNSIDYGTPEMKDELWVR